MKQLRAIFPIFDWLSKYSKKDLAGDLSGGLTVGVMLIPQGMAYAMLAGLPPIYGLYASTIPIFLYALLGSSRQLAVGPVAMASLLVASGLLPLADAKDDPETYLRFAILLALLVGLFRLLLGLMRLGFLVNFLSRPVISGYTSAAALIIGLSQLKHLLGIKIPNSNYIHEVLYHTFLQINHTNFISVAICIGGIGLMLWLKAVNKKYKLAIPGPLAVVVLATTFAMLFSLDAYDLAIVGEVPKGLPSPGLPGFTMTELRQLLPSAITIGLIGFMESIAVAKSIQAKHKTYKIDSNQELVALGVANIGAALFQGFPVNGGFSRSAVNDQANARTQMSGIISATLILFTLLFLTPLFYYLPNAVLASIIMVAVFGLVDYKEVKHLWKTDHRDFWMLVITFLTTLTIGVVEGIAIGVLLSLLMLIYRSTAPHTAILGRIAGTDYYRNLKRFEELEQRPDLLIIRFDAEVYFANVAFFVETLEQLALEKGSGLKCLILDAESINSIDSTAMYDIGDLCQNFEKQGIRWIWCDVKGPVRDRLERAGLTQKIGIENFFISIQDAVDAFVHNDNCKHQKYTLQSNVRNR